ncbi:MAG: CBS domain-containing protein [Yoonia sp.]|jgi:CBS domain-containing protein
MTIERIIKNLNRKIMTINPTALIGDAIGYLARDDTSALVVTNDDHLVLGILSSSDIVKYLDEYGTLSNHLSVSHLMTHNVILCEASENVQRLEQLMIEHQVRHVPITDQGRLCAVVSVLDIVRFRMETAEQEAGQLRNYVSGTG